MRANAPFIGTIAGLVCDVAYFLSVGFCVSSAATLISIPYNVIAGLGAILLYGNCLELRRFRPESSLCYKSVLHIKILTAACSTLSPLHVFTSGRDIRGSKKAGSLASVDVNDFNLHTYRC